MDVACLPETCTDWKNSSSAAACRRIARKYWNQTRLVTSCSSIQASHRYLPGGSAILATGNLTGRILATFTDDALGRWSSIRIRGNQGVHVLIVTAYMVCKTSISSTGPTTAFRQQYSILRAQGIQNPNPRQQFINDLSSFLEHHQSLGDRLLLLGNFNTDLDNPSDSRSLRSMFQQLQLTDLLIHHHPSLAPASTRLRGRRIDSIFGCPQITNLPLHCGMGLFNSIVDSDHRPIYIDVIATDLLQHIPPTIHTPVPRGIHSNNPTECSRYLSALHACLDSHNVFSRANNLTRWTELHGATDRLIRKWEALDRDVTAACLAAERKTGSQDRAPWSPKLHQAHLLVLYWKTTVRQLKLHLDPEPAVADIRFN